LARVRAKGYATTADEMRLGTGSVASRVPVPEGMPRAALGIVVAAEHVHERRLAALVTRAARELGRELRASALPWRA
jgi:DNA-binding IclR family transcriptional regulator